MNDAIKQLQKSAIFNMSLGSKELFHSNFLAWLFERYPSAIVIFETDFLDESGGKNIIIEREKRNIDIIISASNTTSLVVENKFKDIPRAKQLNSYITDYKKNNPYQKAKFILLTLIPASFEVQGWKEILYLDLAMNLRTWRKNATKIISPQHYCYIDDYIEMIENIAELCEKHTKGGNYWFKPEDQKDELRKLAEIRFHDTIKKHQAAKLLEDTEREIGEIWIKWIEDKNDFSLERGSGILRTRPYITFGIKRKISNDKFVVLFIQIEDFQYRRLIAFSDYKIPGNSELNNATQESINMRIKKTDQHNWLFSDKKIGRNSDELILVDEWQNDNVGLNTALSSSAKKVYNKYKPDAIYQYLDIARHESEADKIPIANIAACVAQDLKLAWKLLSNDSYFEKFKTFEL